MKRLSGLLIGALFALLTIAAWGFANRPSPEPAWPSRIQGFAFQPYQKGQDPTRGNLLHFGVQVDDVPAALARVETAGGRRIWPEVAIWGDASVIYVKDLDENVIELTDRSVGRIAELTIEQFPEAAPDAGSVR